MPASFKKIMSELIKQKKREARINSQPMKRNQPVKKDTTISYKLVKYNFDCLIGTDSHVERTATELINQSKKMHTVPAN